MSDLSDERREKAPFQGVRSPGEGPDRQAEARLGQLPDAGPASARSAKARAAQQFEAGNSTREEKDRIDRKADRILADEGS